MKILNVKGIIIFIAILVAVQLVFGLILSPILGKVVVESINKSSGTKIDIGKVYIWPLTLSCSLRDLKVFDPDDDKKTIAKIKKASVKISPLKLLSKQLVLSKLVVSGAVIDLETEPDGTFNVQKLAPAPEGEKEAASKGSVFDRFKEKKDWFGRIYDMVKKKSSKESVEAKKTEKVEAEKIKTVVQKLPRGRRVNFETLSDEYVFQIRTFAIKNSRVNLKPTTGQGVTVDKASILIKNMGIDPIKGARFDRLSLRGKLDSDGIPAGSVNIEYTQAFKRDGQHTSCVMTAKDIDLPSISFIYDDSLPVTFAKGKVTLESDTEIVNDALDSKNVVSLSGQNVTAKNGSATVGIVPISTICDALNQIDPAKFKFNITGTVENPEFKGFQESLMAMLKPYLANVAENMIKEGGVKALEGLLGAKGGSSAAGSGAADTSATSEAVSEGVDALKSLFGNKK